MAIHDYLTLELKRGRPAWRAFAADSAAAADAIESEGGALIGVFSPQLGFASNEAVALVRWPAAAGSVAGIARSGQVVGHRRDVLTPTARPLDGAALRAGGIYVHRWFTIDGDSVDAFVDISARAWVGFEDAYEAEVHGLFAAALTDDDRAAGQARLLLLTWYASHGVWEASREQTVDPDGLFIKRHEMTRSTVGRSSLALAIR
jgi:hypothetical protein